MHIIQPPQTVHRPRGWVKRFTGGRVNLSLNKITHSIWYRLNSTHTKKIVFIFLYIENQLFYSEGIFFICKCTKKTKISWCHLSGNLDWHCCDGGAAWRSRQAARCDDERYSTLPGEPFHTEPGRLVKLSNTSMLLCENSNYWSNLPDRSRLMDFFF